MENDKVFIHIPKTGGTSIRKTLKLPTETYHRRLIDYSPIPENTFAVVRNPYDRAVSMCSHMNNFTHINPEVFERWCLKWNSPILDKKYPEVSFRDSMSSYVTIDGNIAVTDIIRFENLAEDFEKMFGKELLHYNKGNREDYQNYYNETTYSIVTEKYKKDLELFNYSF